jgi:3'-phosphoadenosine 5'-phosphosulfate sulfotransferase (PAPS reductase)/FAD synthetase
MRALAFSGGKDSMACLHLMRDSLDCAIYVNTGYAYPETLALVDYAETIIPVHVVNSDRRGQNDREGIPADVVPIDWTNLGQQITGRKAVTVQSYLGCCYENVSAPLIAKARELGVTELVYGQRSQENHKSPARNGDIVQGIIRLHPIEDWTADEVFDYLLTKMDVPLHFTIEHSSLDCYDCTAYQRHSADRVDWTKHVHPDLHAHYMKRLDALRSTLEAV